MRAVIGAVVAVGLLLVSAAMAESPDPTKSDDSLFSAPIRLKAGEEWIATESPGYASPCWHDMDGDGLQDLIVGQFSGGKMKVYRNLGDGALAAGEWLQAEGAIAEVPGVW